MPHARSMLCSILLGVLPAQQPDPAVPHIAITARVLDPTGKPIAGAGAIHGSGPWTTEQLWNAPPARSDKDGVLQFDLPTTTSWYGNESAIVIGAPGRIVVVVRPWATALEQPEFDLGSIYLFPATTLSGRVADDDGKPLAGVRVHAADRLPARSTTRIASAATVGLETAAVTDEHGIYRLAGAPDAAVRLTFAKAGYGSHATFPVRAATPVRVALPRTGFVTGRVEGADGAELRLFVDFGFECVSLPATIGADGTFQAPLASSEPFRILVTECTSWTSATSERIDGPRDDVVIRLPSTRPQRLVVVAGDQPVPKFTVSASWGSGPEPGPQAWSFQFVPDGTLPLAGRDGAIDLRAPITAEHGTIRVEAPGYARTRLSVRLPMRAELRCELQPEAVCVGRVVDANTGEPLAGAHAFAVAVAGDKGCILTAHRGTVVSGDDGRFRLGGLPPGRWHLQVEHRGFALPAMRPLDVQVGQTLAIDDIRIEPLQPLRGRLIGERVPAGAMIGEVAIMDVHVGAVDGIRYEPSRRLRDVAVGRTGAFDLGPAAGKPVELQLVLPPQHFHGLPLTVPLGAFAPHAEPCEIPLWSPLACKVTGKLSLPEDVIGLAELRVLAIAERTMGMPGMKGPVVVAISDLDPGNGFALQLAPGAPKLAVQDLVTGLVVLPPESLVIGDEASLQHDLRIRQVRAHVVIDAPPGVRLDGAQLQFVAAEVDATWDRVRDRRANGLPLSGEVHECTVAMPPGPLLLRVMRGQKLLGEELVEVPATGPCEFRVPVTEPDGGASEGR